MEKRERHWSDFVEKKVKKWVTGILINQLYPFPTNINDNICSSFSSTLEFRDKKRMQKHTNLQDQKEVTKFLLSSKDTH